MAFLGLRQFDHGSVPRGVACATGGASLIPFRRHSGAVAEEALKVQRLVRTVAFRLRPEQVGGGKLENVLLISLHLIVCRELNRLPPHSACDEL